MDTEKEVKPMNEAAAINETLHRVARKVHPLAQDNRQAIQNESGDPGDSTSLRAIRPAAFR